MISHAIAATLLLASAAGDAATAPDRLERSYWLHASLGQAVQKGYWGPSYRAAEPPSRSEVQRAAQLLAGHYGANRLYLIYHGEIPVEQAKRTYAWWHELVPREVELVPTLVLKMYDREQTPTFSPVEVRLLAQFFRQTVNRQRIAVYDVVKGRDQGRALDELARVFPRGLVRVGLQPGEEPGTSFTQAVEDTWSGFCHGTRNTDDWQQPGFGAQTLRAWVEARNSGNMPVAWDLIAVAWDYRTTPRGAYPGYDDARKNQPLPAGRNLLGVELIRRAAHPARLAGFSSDLYILQENSRNAAHDGPAGCFYVTLRDGREYRGHYAAPLEEVARIYRLLRAGRWP